MAIELTGEKAILLNKGCKYDRKIKELQEKLKEIKIELEIEEPGTYTNDIGDVLIVTRRDRFEDIPPSRLLKYLKSKRRGTKFINCIKVHFTKAKRYIDEADIPKLRKKKGETISFSWK